MTLGNNFLVEIGCRKLRRERNSNPKRSANLHGEAPCALRAASEACSHQLPSAVSCQSKSFVHNGTNRRLVEPI